MPKEAIKSLTIEYLRGSITPFDLNFEKGKKLTIVYGENGTGKSTICDAFDFLGNGRIGSLENRGLGKTGKYWPTIGKGPLTTTVKLDMASGPCVATLSGASVAVHPIDQRPIVNVLRRSQILSLVEATPADRYEAIRHFIDVSGVEKSENNLRALIQDIERQAGISLSRIQENRDTIRRFWEQVKPSEKNPVKWARAETAKQAADSEPARKAIDQLKDAYKRLFDYPGKLTRLKDNIINTNQAIQDHENEINKLSEQVAGEYLEILEILHAAQKHFVSHPDPKVCPLCESAEKVSGLPQQVSERIRSQDAGNRLKREKQAQETRRQLLSELEQELEDLFTQANEAAEGFSLAAQNEILPDSFDATDVTAPDNLEEWGVWLKNREDVLARIDAVSDQLLESQRFIETLRGSLQALDANSAIKHDLEKILPRLSQAHEIIKTKRKEFTDKILHGIAQEVGRLYEAVHPGEGLNKISLELNPQKRASLEMAAEFQGMPNTPPAAYFSDSHLDTLGFCVFLALAQKDNPDETILVLDDVLGSVDEPHVERLIEMLYSEAVKFRQCIITTHYKPWKQKLRWGWLQNGQCQFIELSKWSLTGGISLINSVPDIERLRALLEETPPDPQLVCAKAGVILEAALDFLTSLYECKVPRRPGGLYTLGDLLPAIDKKLRAALKVEHKQEEPDGTINYVEKELAPHLDEITRIAQSRNVFGAHFNALSFELLDTDAIGFGVEVLVLMDCLIDYGAGWPRSKKSGSYWATADETRRLHPLVRPN